MIRPMSRLQIIGLKKDLNDIIQILHQFGKLQIDDIHNLPESSSIQPYQMDESTRRNQEDILYLSTQLDGVMEALKVSRSQAHQDTDNASNDLTVIRSLVQQLIPQIQQLQNQKQALNSELEILPRYADTLARLLPLVPDAADQPGYATIGIMLHNSQEKQIDVLREKLKQVATANTTLVSGAFDESTLAVLIIAPQADIANIDSFLGGQNLPRLQMPEDIGHLSPQSAFNVIQQRLEAIPTEIESIEKQLAELRDSHAFSLFSAHRYLQNILDEYAVLSCVGATAYTFILFGWLPTDELEALQASLQPLGEKVDIQSLPVDHEIKKKMPVALLNQNPTRHFEGMVKMYSSPGESDIDPSLLMTIFLPLFFGMMVGDLGYGVILLLLSLWLSMRLKEGSLKDIANILLLGSGWTIFFGILYGEFFGTLGEHFGMHSIWINRFESGNLTSLLLIACGVGAVHIIMGLIIGIWRAVVGHNPNHLMERSGMLIGLIGLFLLVGAMTQTLPDGMMTPAVATIIVGVVLLGIPMGISGILIAPVEFISLIGNILSYMRIAAIGLAGVYLAQVANQIGSMIGSIVIGVIVASLIHALNLVMSAFSPTIHSLRLQYVEFFRKFYEGGGHPYQPFHIRPVE
jgi:V/A-type H+-transporting ATPase subunit I